MLNKNYLFVILFCFTILLSTDLLFYYQGIIVDHEEICDENGLIENIQVVILFITMLIYLVYAVVRPLEFKVLFWIGALLFFSFIIREVDMEELSIPFLLKFLLGADGKTYTMVILWLAALLKYTSSLKINYILTKKLLLSRVGMIMACSLIMLIVSHLVERHVVHIAHYQFFEEILELNGYILMLVAAVILPSVIEDQSTGL